MTRASSGQLHVLDEAGLLKTFEQSRDAGRASASALDEIDAAEPIVVGPREVQQRLEIVHRQPAGTSAPPPRARVAAPYEPASAWRTFRARLVVDAILDGSMFILYMLRTQAIVHDEPRESNERHRTDHRRSRRAPGTSIPSTRASASPSATQASARSAARSMSFDAKLVDGRLEGVVKVASVNVDDENLAGHLQTPRLLRRRAVPRAPLRLEVDRAGRRSRLDRRRPDASRRHEAGRDHGHRRPARSRTPTASSGSASTWRRPSTATTTGSPGTWSSRAAARPSATTSSSPPTSRWCRRSPMKILAISGSLRAGLAQHRPAAGGCRRRARRRRHRRSTTGSRRSRRTTPTTTSRATQPAPVRRFKDGARGGGRGADRDARVQLVDPGRAQERARLGFSAARRVAGAEQAGRRALVEHGDVRRRLGRGRDPQGARSPRRPHARGHDRRGEGRPAARERRRRDAARRAPHRRRRARRRRSRPATRRGPPPRRSGSARRRPTVSSSASQSTVCPAAIRSTWSRSPSAAACASSRWS